MTAIHQKSGKTRDKKQPAKSKTADPNEIHDVYTEVDLDPAYDETIADDIAFDYDGQSKDPGDRPPGKKGKK